MNCTLATLTKIVLCNRRPPRQDPRRKGERPQSMAIEHVETLIVGGGVSI